MGLVAKIKTKVMLTRYGTKKKLIRLRAVPIQTRMCQWILPSFCIFHLENLLRLLSVSHRAAVPLHGYHIFHDRFVDTYFFRSV